MRRKDREMNEEFGLKVIDKSVFGTIALQGEDFTYSVPLSIVRDNRTLYFHSAKEGKKTEILRNNPRVCVSFVGDVKVPDFLSHEELREISKDKLKLGTLISKVFTTQYESAMCFGKVEEVLDDEEKIKALKIISQKYTPNKMEFFDKAIEIGLKRTAVFKIEIEEFTSKRKKLNEKGEELKWGK